MMIFMAVAAGFLGYAMGYAVAFNDLENQVRRLSNEVKFWKDICNRKMNKNTDVKWHPPPPSRAEL